MIEPIARVRIELREIEPTLWRRVDIPLTSTLLALHDIIQVTVGWTDSHLFEFVVGGRVYGDRVYSEPLSDDELFERKVCNAEGVRLRTLIGRGVERLLYVYDFGDDWCHDVIIEDVRDEAPDIDYPAFVAGERRRCPPEDVGGVPGFMRFLEAALNPFDDEQEEVLTWYGKPFDRDDIDKRYVRMALTTIANRRRGALMRHRASGRRLRT